MKEYADGGYMADGGKVPAHFGSGKNINVFGYQTENFDICATAVKEFESAIQIMDNGKETYKESLAKCAKYIDNLFGIEKYVVENGDAEDSNFYEAISDIMSASIYNYRAEMSINLFSFVPQHLKEIAVRMAKAEKGGLYALGGMTAGRFYKDKSGEEFKFIGKIDSGANKGKFLFNDGQKSVYKDLEDFEGGTPKETKLFGFFEEGGMLIHGFQIGDTILEIYKGYGIVENNNNGVIEVLNPNRGTRFIIDLDESKPTGRKSMGMSKDEQIESAKRYIDYLDKPLPDTLLEKFRAEGKMADGGMTAYQGMVSIPNNDKRNYLLENLMDTNIDFRNENYPYYIDEELTKIAKKNGYKKHEAMANSLGYFMFYDLQKLLLNKYGGNTYKSGASDWVYLYADGGSIPNNYEGKTDKEYVVADMNYNIMGSFDTENEAQEYAKKLSRKDGEIYRFGNKQKIERFAKEDGYMAKGGEINYTKNWRVFGITMQGKRFEKEITLGRMSDKNDVMNALKRMPDTQIREVTSIQEVMAKGGELSVFEKNQIKIAKDTLKMSNEGASLMGGMTKDEAKKILQKYKVKYADGGETAKFEVDDVVYHKGHNTIGIVRMEESRGEVKTDADGNVNVDELQYYNPLKHEAHKNANIAPSTFKEIEERGLWNPFNDRTSQLEKGGYMAEGGKVGGRGWEGATKGERVKDIKDFVVGGVYLAYSPQFNAKNLIRITSLDKTKLNRPLVYASYVRKDKNDEDFVIWDYELKYDEYYRAKEDKMAKGGKVKFADKVKSVQESLLKRKKVAPQVQKDYGKTYSKAEAKESAQRIVGSRMAQLKEKMAKKKK